MEPCTQSFFSGVLLGAEIASVARDDARTIVLAAGVQLAQPYALAIGEILRTSR